MEGDYLPGCEVGEVWFIPSWAQTPYIGDASPDQDVQFPEGFGVGGELEIMYPAPQLVIEVLDDGLRLISPGPPGQFPDLPVRRIIIIITSIFRAGLIMVLALEILSSALELIPEKDYLPILSSTSSVTG